MKSCVLLGLYEPHLRNADFNAMRFLLGELWTMNDFYQFFPALRPDRAFNIHRNFVKHPDPLRFRRSWIEEYNGSGVCAAYVTSHFEGLRNEIMYPLERISEEFDPCFQSSTVTMMLALAKLEGFKKISLRGFHMLGDGEYSGQIPQLVKTIEILEGENLSLDVPMLDAWRSKLSSSRIDWRRIRPALRPYWDDSPPGAGFTVQTEGIPVLPCRFSL